MNLESDTTVFINAGGKGTRLNSAFSPHPEKGVAKGLLRIGGSSITLIEHQIEKLKQSSFKQIIACVGMHTEIAEHLANSSVISISSNPELGTGGDLIQSIRMRPELFSEDVFVINVDTVLELDEHAFISWHKNKGAQATIALTERKNVPNENAYRVDFYDRVIYCSEVFKNQISGDLADIICQYSASSSGAIVVNRDFMKDYNWSSEDGMLSLYKDVVSQLIKNGTMFAFNNGKKFFLDIGTVKAWEWANNNAEYVLSVFKNTERVTL